MRGYYGYVVEVDIEPGLEASDNFDTNDMNYYKGDVRQKTPDFDLHLALYLLQKELLPKELLEPIKQWARENKTAGFHFEKILQPS